MQRAPLLLLMMLAGVMIGSIVVNTIYTTADPIPYATPSQLAGSSYQQHVCPCKNDWPLATNERILSNEIFSQVGSIPDPHGLTALVAFFGQFIDHTIVLSRSDPSQGLFQLMMTPGTSVLNMTRNAFRLKYNGCRETISDESSLIDAASVYGSDIDRLRMPNSCKLRTSAGNLLPLKEDNTFDAGDPRNTEHSVLASIHTLWMREHNRLCDEMPSHWTEVQKFWKARQVLIAKLQHIVYEEWLPRLFGSQKELLSTTPLKGSGVGIAMEFSVIAYRMGHSLIPDPVGPFALPTLFFNAQILIDNGIEPLLSAAYTTPAQRVDNKVVDGLRNFMFSAGPSVMGEDLVTRNIFRSREVGMAEYEVFARCYGVTPNPQASQIAQGSPYIGVLSEPLVPGSSLPRTIAVVIAEQFKRLRDYDPNFYTKRSGAIGATFYKEVQQTTMATIIRRNTNLMSVPDHVF